jgi:hypothetical protein
MKNDLEGKEEQLKVVLDKEDLDVKKLEGISLTHLFHSAFGNLEENLNKERQEALAAQLKYDQAVNDLKHIEDEILRLSMEKDQYKESPEKYRQLLSMKKTMLLAQQGGAGNQILEITYQINNINNQNREISEAIAAGKNALHHLYRASKSLDSAEDWGTWDMFGGGLMTDMIKHSHIDDAKSEVENTQKALVNFRTELADIKINSDIRINIDGFSKFADFFFDGLIADWCMQSRIQESSQSVQHVIDQVESVLDKLKIMQDVCMEQMGQLERNMNELITNA